MDAVPPKGYKDHGSPPGGHSSQTSSSEEYPGQGSPYEGHASQGALLEEYLNQDPRPDPSNQLVSKQWIVPPRPKPGRKPADDSPISKRKAQNRQAQRNFRERKAKKIDELEAEMIRMKEQFQFSQTALVQQHENDRIQKDTELKSMKDRLVTLADELKAKAEEAETLKRAAVADEAKQQQSMDQSWQHLSFSSAGSRNAPAGGTAGGSYDANAGGAYERFGSFQSLGTTRSSFSLPSPTSALPFQHALPNPNLGYAESEVCGKCRLKVGLCQCVEDHLRQLPPPNQPSNMESADQQQAQQPDRNAQKPTAPVQQPTPGEEMEIDFTMSFSRNLPQSEDTSSFDGSERVGTTEEHCGFCLNSDTCPCKEHAAAMKVKEESSNITKGNLSPRQTPVAQTTVPNRPQPIEPKVSLTEPGNCPSCRADPAKANFCRSLAAMKTPSILKKPAVPPKFISCSAAFDKLREDPTFTQADDGQRSLMIQRLNQRHRLPAPGRTPLMVEHASLLLSLSSGPLQNK